MSNSQSKKSIEARKKSQKIYREKVIKRIEISIKEDEKDKLEKFEKIDKKTTKEKFFWLIEKYCNTNG